MFRYGKTAMAVLGAALALTPAQAETGNPNLKSIDAIAFGPNATLIVGDGRGGQIVTIETGDLSPGAKDHDPIKSLRKEIGGRFGTDAKGIEVLKLAVNPASRTAYAAVRVMSSKKETLVTIKGDGTIREFALDSVNFKRYALPAGEKGPITKITDVSWAGDRILAAAQANDVFASKIISIVPRPNEEPIAFGTETYHVAHSKWETKAPIRTVIPYEEDGKRYLVGAFTCTPIVKFALDDMTAGKVVKGTSLIELGSGNTPLDMFTYEAGGKTYILMNHIRFHHAKNPVGPSPNWTAKVDASILREAQAVNEKAIHRVKGKASESITDRATVAQDYHGVVHMDRYDATRALVLRTANDDLELTTLRLP